jgi:hypothetical protein
MRSALRLPSLLATLLLATALPLTAQANDRITFDADIRTGYFQVERDQRDGSHSTTRDLRVRMRPGIAVRLSSVLDSRLRVAGRYSTSQDGVGFYLEPHVPATDGLEPGQATLDEAYVNVRPAARWNLRLGRMQTKFALADLMAKSLDRGDSPNTDITWTDGGHLTFSGNGGWRSHLVVQHNSRQGPSNALRSPLSFDHDASRIALFAALENREAHGTFRQRGLDVTFIPRSLPGPEGAASDYLAFLARGMFARPLPLPGSTLAFGGELGYAPTTPTRAELGIGDADHRPVSGLAFQVAATLQDVRPGHWVGLVYARTQPGWLIAPDFRGNDELLELRYEWRTAPGRSTDARVRLRDEILRPATALRDRRDLDVYLRYTARF